MPGIDMPKALSRALQLKFNKFVVIFLNLPLEKSHYISGLPMYDAPNAVEELKQPRKHPTPEKVEAIKDALKHFEVI